MWYGMIGHRGNIGIYFKKSVDSGETWTQKRLTWNKYESFGASIAVNGSYIYVVWEDHFYSPRFHEIFLKKSADGGNTWTIKRLTWNEGYSAVPSIAVNGANIYVVWCDDTPSVVTLDNFEIFFKMSTDGGQTWDARETY